MSRTDPSPFAALLDELAETDDERATMATALDLLAYAAPPATPVAGLRTRVLERIAEPRPPVFSVGISLFARSNDMEWLPYAPGVQVKLLYVDPATGAQTVLVKMEPNVPFPEHPHPAIEDLFLIEGDAYVGDVLMRAGDYCTRRRRRSTTMSAPGRRGRCRWSSAGEACAPGEKRYEKRDTSDQIPANHPGDRGLSAFLLSPFSFLRRRSASPPRPAASCAGSARWS